MEVESIQGNFFPFRTNVLFIAEMSRKIIRLREGLLAIVLPSVLSN
jgi:hypothetical protein